MKQPSGWDKPKVCAWISSILKSSNNALLLAMGSSLSGVHICKDPSKPFCYFFSLIVFCSLQHFLCILILMSHPSTLYPLPFPKNSKDSPFQPFLSSQTQFRESTDPQVVLSLALCCYLAMPKTHIWERSFSISLFPSDVIQHDILQFFPCRGKSHDFCYFLEVLHILLCIYIIMSFLLILNIEHELQRHLLWYLFLILFTSVTSSMPSTHPFSEVYFG